MEKNTKKNIYIYIKKTESLAVHQKLTQNCKSTILQLKKKRPRASLVAQWLRICLPMQGTRVRALVWEDPTCRGATKPVRHNC